MQINLLKNTAVTHREKSLCTLLEARAYQGRKLLDSRGIFEAEASSVRLLNENFIQSTHVNLVFWVACLTFLVLLLC